MFSLHDKPVSHQSRNALVSSRSFPVQTHLPHCLRSIPQIAKLLPLCIPLLYYDLHPGARSFVYPPQTEVVANPFVQLDSIVAPATLNAKGLDGSADDEWVRVELVLPFVFTKVPCQLDDEVEVPDVHDDDWFLWRRTLVDVV